MPIFVSNNHALFTGPEAAQVFKTILNKIRQAGPSSTNDWSDILGQLLNSETDSVAKKLLQLLKGYLDEGKIELLKSLLASLEEISQRTVDDDRRFGWPNPAWSQKFEGDLPVSLILDASGEVWYEVMKEEADIDAKIHFLGSLGAQVEGATTIHEVGFSGGVNAKISRSIDYHLRYSDKSTPLGLAIAGGLGKLCIPHQFDRVREAFNADSDTKLDALYHAGNAEIEGSAKLSVAIPVQVGSIGLALGGKIGFGRGFSMKAIPAEQGAIQVKGNLERSQVSGFTLGASYKVGLSSLSPNAAQELLKATSTISDGIDKLDQILDQAQSFLKPGTLLKSKIADALEAKLGQASNGDEEAKILLYALGSIFGADVDLETLSDELLQSIQESSTELIAKILDDTLGIFGEANDALISKISDSLGTQLSDKARDLIREYILSGLLDELEDILNGAIQQVDQALTDFLTDLLGHPPQDLIEEAKKVLDQARSLLSEIIKGVAASVDELVGIEIGFEREKQKNTAYDFALKFTSLHAEEYKASFINPSKIGDWILGKDVPPDLQVDSFMRETLVGTTSTLSFGLTVATIKLSSETRVSSSAKIVRTPEGIAIFAKGDVTKIKTFFDEVSSTSFISATAIQSAKVLEAGGTTFDPSSNGVSKSNDSTVMAVPKLSLSLTEEDGNLKEREVEKLLTHFVERGLVQSPIKDELVDAVAAAKVGNEDLEAELSLNVAVPPLQIRKLIEYGAGNPEEVIVLTKRALALEDPESVIKSAEKSGIDPARALDLLPKASAALAHPLEESGGAEATIAFTILENLDLLIETAEKQDTNQALMKASTEASDTSYLRLLKKATVALHEAFVIANSIYEADTELSASQLEKKQREMAKTVGSFIAPRHLLLDLIPFIGGKSRLRTVAMFRALQQVSQKALQTAPPMVISFRPKNGEGRVFVSSSTPL